MVNGLLIFLGFALTTSCFDCPGFQWTLSYKNLSNFKTSTSEVLDTLNFIRSIGILISLFGLSILFSGIYLSNNKKWACVVSIIPILIIVYLVLFL